MTTFLPAQSLLKDARADAVIFEGEVLSQEGCWSADRSTVYTINWVRPLAFFNDYLALDSIPVLTHGGFTDDGLLVVPHSLHLSKDVRYLLAVSPCRDCIDDLTTYRPQQAIGDFHPDLYSHELGALRDRPLVTSSIPNSPCNPRDTSIRLYTRFGNLHVSADWDSAYVDVLLKSTAPGLVLSDYRATVRYDEAVFGSYAVSSGNLDAVLTDPNLSTHYQFTKADSTYKAAKFDLARNTGASQNIVLDTAYHPVMRLAFSPQDIDFAAIDPNTPLLTLSRAWATYLCNGQPFPFLRYTLRDGPIPIVIGGLETTLTYTIGNVSYNSNDSTYRFTVFAASSAPTRLDRAVVELQYGTTAFFPSQVTGGDLTILTGPGTLAGDNAAYLPPISSDLAANVVRIVLDNNADSPAELSVLDDQPRALFTVEMKMADCEAMPLLAFRETQMQDESTFYLPNDVPFPFAYEPVLANDTENVIPCGDDKPVIDSFSPEEIVAGDGSILTITGENFGVFERGDPANNGTLSSVLFTNGDYVSSTLTPNTDPFTAAAEADFTWDGVLHWTDTEIQVRVPSTNYQEGFKNPAASGAIKVRNRANKTDTKSKLDIPYSLFNYRQFDEKVAKPIGLWNGENSNNGYVFDFHTSTDANGGKVRNAFIDALNLWCAETSINFRLKPGSTTQDWAPNDGRSTVDIEPLSTENALAALKFGTIYFFANRCEDGFIMRELDIVASENFVNNNTQASIRNRLLHELGHAHMLNHALATGGIFTPTPLMHPQGASSIKEADALGANRIYDTSLEIKLSGECTSDFDPIFPAPEQCGMVVAAETLIDVEGIKVYPIPTQGLLMVEAVTEDLHFTDYTLFDLAGRKLENGIANAGRHLLIDLHAYAAGVYFLWLDTPKGHARFKIVRQ